MFGLSGSVLNERIEALSVQLGFEGMTRRLVRQLSGGQQRKVEIARALLNAPELLIMDEASAGLDVSSRRNLVREIRALSRDHHVAVLWATHLVDEVMDADEIVVLDRGKVVATGDPAALARNAGMIDLTDAYEALIGAG